MIAYAPHLWYLQNGQVINHHKGCYPKVTSRVAARDMRGAVDRSPIW
jgi:hypothetical protein